MARRRFEQLSDARRDEILRTATQEFARSGFHRTSYNQLLERLGLGKSSAYYYFEDKRDLFLTAVERCYAAFFAKVDGLERPTDRESFWIFVEHASRLGYEFMLDDPVAAKLMLCLQRERQLLDELASERLLESMRVFYGSLIAEGHRWGALRTDLPPDLLVELVRDTTMTFDRWFVTACAGATPPSATVAARTFTEVIGRLCKPQ